MKKKMFTLRSFSEGKCITSCVYEHEFSRASRACLTHLSFILFDESSQPRLMQKSTVDQTMKRIDK